MAGVLVEVVDGDGDVVEEEDGDGDEDLPHGLASGVTENGVDEPDGPGNPGPPGPGSLLPEPLGDGFELPPASPLDSEQPEEDPVPVESPPPLHASAASDDERERAKSSESESVRVMSNLLGDVSFTAETDGARDRRTKNRAAYFTRLVAHPKTTSSRAFVLARASPQVDGQSTIRPGFAGES